MNICICGLCGETKSGEGGFCSHCKGDHWVEKEDFDNPEHNEHVYLACQNLGLTINELKDKFEPKPIKIVSRWSKFLCWAFPCKWGELLLKGDKGNPTTHSNYICTRCGKLYRD